MAAHQKRTPIPVLRSPNNAFDNKGVAFWLHVSRRRARAIGLTGADADDYVSAFLLRCACFDADTSPALLYRAGANAGVDYLRGHQRVTKNEISWPDANDAAPFEPVSPGMPSEICALRSEISARITEALLRLTEEQQTVFRLCIVEEKTAAEAAHSTNRTSHAVRQALCSLLKRLRVILEQGGFTDTDAREYLQLLRQGNGTLTHCAAGGQKIDLLCP